MSENYLKKELYQRVTEDSEIFDFLQESALDGVWYWDLEDQKHEWLSPNFWETLGYDPKEKKHLASEWQSIIHKEDFKLVEENFERHLKDPNHPFDQVVRYYHRNGNTLWIRCRGFAIRDSAGQPTRMLGLHMDVTKMMRSQDELNRLKNEYEKVFNGTQDAMFLIKVNGPRDFQFIRNNQSHQRKTGITQPMIAGKTPYELLGPEAGDIVIDHYQECIDKKTPISYEEVLDLPAGKHIWYTTLTPIIKNNDIINIVGSAVDITERKAIEKELERRANYDQLTNLPNRQFLTRKIEEYVENSDNKFVFLFIDLNEFKAINDNFGHAVGDILLKKVAERLKSLLNSDDFVSRLGGDEFVILKHDIYYHDEIERFKENVITALKKPFDYESQALHISASVGFSRFPHDGSNYDNLANRADKAMYSMKNKKQA